MSALQGLTALALAALALAGCGAEYDPPSRKGHPLGFNVKPDNRVIGGEVRCVDLITARLADPDFAKLNGIEFKRGTTIEERRLDLAADGRLVCASLPPDTTVDDAAERLADEVG